MSSVAAQPTRAVSASWSKLQRAAFRLGAVFIFLTALPELLFPLPFGPEIVKAMGNVWVAVVPWVSKHILHLPKEMTKFGNGDSAFAYVAVPTYALVSLGVGLVWTLLDRRRTEYQTLYYWLRACVRFSLAWSLLIYGTVKLSQVQFPTPPLTSLLLPFGELTPHGLLWNYMGFSRTYQVFAGSVECLGAVLLFWRRTTTLGALILIGAMTNVLVTNIAYGVSVKVIAARLLLLAVFLTLPDVRRLVHVLVLHRSTEAAEAERPVLRRAWMERVAFAVKMGLAAYLVGSTGVRAYELAKPLQDAAKRPPLYGQYRVQRFVLSGQEVATDASRRWEMVAFDGVTLTYQTAVVRRADERWERFQTTYDRTRQTVNMVHENDPKRTSAFTYTRPDPDQVILSGSWDKELIEITLRRLPDPRFPLLNPEYRNWIPRW